MDLYEAVETICKDYCKYPDIESGNKLADICDKCPMNKCEDLRWADRKDEPTTQTETQNSNLTFEKDECAKEYEELGLKELKELIKADRKTEPQTYVINPQEPTNDDKCFECDDFFTCGGQCNKIEDEPQTENDFTLTYTCSFSDCENFKHFGFGEKCIECKRKQSEVKHKDEPQTDCSWKKGE